MNYFLIVGLIFLSIKFMSIYIKNLQCIIQNYFNYRLSVKYLTYTYISLEEEVILICQDHICKCLH